MAKLPNMRDEKIDLRDEKIDLVAIEGRWRKANPGPWAHDVNATTMYESMADVLPLVVVVRRQQALLDKVMNIARSNQELCDRLERSHVMTREVEKIAKAFEAENEELRGRIDGQTTV